MAEHSPLIVSLLAAVDAHPEDVPLRLHVAELLVAAGDASTALLQLSAVLSRDPGSERAMALMRNLAGTAPTSPPPPPPAAPPQAPPQAPPAFDWLQAEAELEDVVAPMFVEEDGPVPGAELYDVETARTSLADVAGMEQVKARLEAAFLAPMRNPELRTLYGKSLRGGLLLYGPPGCGKTFLARAVAGEMGARFVAVTLADVLDMYVGSSERNLHALFETVRANAPCVLFLDEVDAIGQKRSQLRNSALRQVVNQLLVELDDVHANNEGVFVLGATNHPWDVDAALRRPGRFDRTLLVLPPDLPAREAIVKLHLRDRPVAGVDARKIAKATDGYSGADIAHLCEGAAERAMLDSARTGQVRMIGQADLEAALKEVKPSTGAWLQLARNVAMFGNESGEYDDLVAYLKKQRLV
ncbi:ATP-binding protein [Acidothermaceae bacterium B102]|nr:ATP-binding protein [Acidothermaceae bacterium B102]